MFRLVFGDHELALQLPFEPHIEDQLVAAIQRISREDVAEGRDQLGSRIVECITALLEHHATPPTDKQVKYAIAIARELSLQLPPEVLQFRDAMTQFLHVHAETYRRRRAISS